MTTVPSCVHWPARRPIFLISIPRASGPGAEAREAIGWVIVGGLGLAAVFTLFLTPAAYALVSGFTAARASSAQALEKEMDALKET